MAKKISPDDVWMVPQIEKDRRLFQEQRILWERSRRMQKLKRFLSIVFLTLSIIIVVVLRPHEAWFVYFGLVETTGGVSAPVNVIYLPYVGL